MKGMVVWSCCFLSLLFLSGAQLPPFPLEDVVQQAIANIQAAPTPTPTGLSKKDYLSTISGIVTFFRQYQDSTGRIIDPYAKQEIQYSTPTYAHASAVLASVTGDQTTINSAIAALNISLVELITNTCADGHTNFFALPIMLAIEAFQPYVSPALVEFWLAQAAKINPDVYVNLGTNWGIVAAGGEFIRYLHGLTNLSWIEERLSQQISQFDANGMFVDPTPITNPPMPYDIFPRHYLEVMLYRGYNGTYLQDLMDLLDRASYASLLMQSPLGELPTGGRSSQHQWNEAVQCVIYELRASLQKNLGNMVLASAYKRAARLAHKSVRNWIQPTGDLFIVKNRFNPALRFGYEDYSFLSNYNNLPASMLAMAYTFADDSIPEGPSFAEVGGFAFAVPTHHKIFANVLGNYLQIETCANPQYDATGLTRVHHPNVEDLIGPTAGSPELTGARAIGIVWKKGDLTQSLAQYGTGSMQVANFSLISATAETVEFEVYYNLNASKGGVSQVYEKYSVYATNFTQRTQVTGEVDSVSVVYPVFLYDGQTNTTFKVSTSNVVMSGDETYSVTSPNFGNIAYYNIEVASRNGYLGLAASDSVSWSSGSFAEITVSF